MAWWLNDPETEEEKRARLAREAQMRAMQAQRDGVMTRRPQGSVQQLLRVPSLLGGPAPERAPLQRPQMQQADMAMTARTPRQRPTAAQMTAGQPIPSMANAQGRPTMPVPGIGLGDVTREAFAGASLGNEDTVAGIANAIIPGGYGYEEGRDAVRQQSAEFGAAHPGAQAGLQMAGMLTQMPLYARGAAALGGSTRLGAALGAAGGVGFGNPETLAEAGAAALYGAATEGIADDAADLGINYVRRQMGGPLVQPRAPLRERINRAPLPRQAPSRFDRIVTEHIENFGRVPTEADREAAAMSGRAPGQFGDGAPLPPRRSRALPEIQQRGQPTEAEREAAARAGGSQGAFPLRQTALRTLAAGAGVAGVAKGTEDDNPYLTAAAGLLGGAAVPGGDGPTPGQKLHTNLPKDQAVEINKALKAAGTRAEMRRNPDGTFDIIARGAPQEQPKSLVPAEEAVPIGRQGDRPASGIYSRLHRRVKNMTGVPEKGMTVTEWVGRLKGDPDVPQSELKAVLAAQNPALKEADQVVSDAIHEVKSAERRIKQYEDQRNTRVENQTNYLTSVLQLTTPHKDALKERVARALVVAERGGNRAEIWQAFGISDPDGVAAQARSAYEDVINELEYAASRKRQYDMEVEAAEKEARKYLRDHLLAKVSPEAAQDFDNAMDALDTAEQATRADFQQKHDALQDDVKAILAAKYAEWEKDPGFTLDDAAQTDLRDHLHRHLNRGTSQDELQAITDAVVAFTEWRYDHQNARKLGVMMDDVMGQHTGVQDSGKRLTREEFADLVEKGSPITQLTRTTLKSGTTKYPKAGRPAPQPRYAGRPQANFRYYDEGDHQNGYVDFTEPYDPDNPPEIEWTPSEHEIDQEMDYRAEQEQEYYVGEIDGHLSNARSELDSIEGLLAKWIDADEAEHLVDRARDEIPESYEAGVTSFPSDQDVLGDLETVLDEIQWDGDPDQLEIEGMEAPEERPARDEIERVMQAVRDQLEEARGYEWQADNPHDNIDRDEITREMIENHDGDDMMENPDFDEDKHREFTAIQRALERDENPFVVDDDRTDEQVAADEAEAQAEYDEAYRAWEADPDNFTEYATAGDLHYIDTQMETENRGKPQKESLVHLPGFGERAGHFGSKGTDLIAHTRGFKQDDETFRLMESQSDVAARNRYINRTTRPLMSTDRWTNLTTAASILEAVEQPGVKWFEWSDAKNRYTNASLRESAGETTYNIHTKRALEQIFKHLGLKMPQVEKTQYGFRIPLSEEFIELVKKHGVSALGVAGLLGATQAEKEEGKSRPLIPGGS